MTRVDCLKRGIQLISALQRINESGQREILVTDFSDTLQGKDTSKVVDLMTDKHGRACFRVKYNVKSIDPLAGKVYQEEYFDCATHTAEEIEAHVRMQEFDFPLWYKHHPSFEMRRINDFNVPFIVQVAGCNFHDGGPTDGCRFCFVDQASNDGKPGAGKAWLSAEDCLDAFLMARERLRQHYLQETGFDINLRVLRISGGEPTLVLPWIVDLWHLIESRGLDREIVCQVDTNLSTLSDDFLRSLENEMAFNHAVGSGFVSSPEYQWFHSLEENLRILAGYGVKFLAGMKGCDSVNVASNTQSNQTLVAQLQSLRRLVDFGLDVYPQMYNPNPETLTIFLEFVDNFLLGNFSSRVHVGPLKLYGPNRERLMHEAEEAHIERQCYVLGEENKWTRAFRASEIVMNEYLLSRYRRSYKQITRSDVTPLLR